MVASCTQLKDKLNWKSNKILKSVSVVPDKVLSEASLSAFGDASVAHD